jgi:MFS family permease
VTLNERYENFKFKKDKIFITRIKILKVTEVKLMDIKRILISGVVIWLVGTVFGFLTCGWLFNWVYTLPPNIWKDPAVNLTGLACAIIFTSVYALLYKGIPGEGVKKGMTYGILVWLVGALTGIASMPFYMTIATTVVVYWLLQALVLGLINGAIVGSIYKE